MDLQRFTTHFYITLDLNGIAINVIDSHNKSAAGIDGLTIIHSPCR